MIQKFRLIGIRCTAILKEDEVKKQSIVNFFNSKKGIKAK